jgi:hypothetical protein
MLTIVQRMPLPYIVPTPSQKLHNVVPQRISILIEKPLHIVHHAPCKMLDPKLIPIHSWPCIAFIESVIVVGFLQEGGILGIQVKVYIQDKVPISILVRRILSTLNS